MPYARHAYAPAGSPSVSVTLMHCDHIVQQRLEFGTWLLDRCLSNVHNSTNHSIPWSRSLQRKTSGAWENLEFCIFTITNDLCVQGLTLHLLSICWAFCINCYWYVSVVQTYVIYDVNIIWQEYLLIVSLWR